MTSKIDFKILEWLLYLCLLLTNLWFACPFTRTFFFLEKCDFKKRPSNFLSDRIFNFFRVMHFDFLLLFHITSARHLYKGARTSGIFFEHRASGFFFSGILASGIVHFCIEHFLIQLGILASGIMPECPKHLTFTEYNKREQHQLVLKKSKAKTRCNWH